MRHNMRPICLLMAPLWAILIAVVMDIGHVLSTNEMVVVQELDSLEGYEHVQCPSANQRAENSTPFAIRCQRPINVPVIVEVANVHVNNA